MTNFGRAITVTITAKPPQSPLPTNWPQRDELEDRLRFLLSVLGSEGYVVFDAQLSMDDKKAIQAWVTMDVMAESMRMYTDAMLTSAFKPLTLKPLIMLCVPLSESSVGV